MAKHRGDKQAYREKSGRKPVRIGRMKVIAVLVVLLSLMVTSGIVAQRGMLRSLNQRAKSVDPTPLGGDRISPAAHTGIAFPASLTAPNPSKEYVYAGGRLIATEEPVGSASCSVSLTPQSDNFLAIGGNGTISVAAPAGCSWTATTANSFITITSGSVGSGNGSVGYNVAANPGGALTGTILIKDKTFTVTQDAAAAATNSAAFITQNVPATMTSGQSYNVSVTMRNNGTTTWTVDNYKLGSQNPADNLTWALNRVNVPATISPGADAVFNFSVTAPSAAGTYNFQWRMLKEGAGSFGASSTNIAVTVTAVSGGPAGRITPLAVTASAQQSANPAQRAIDGNIATSWIAGNLPVQWLQLDLGQTSSITQVRMNVEQFPAGQTVHEIWGGLQTSSLTLLRTVSGFTQDGQWLETNFSPAAGNVRYLRVVTTTSPSWVAWAEIEVYGITGSSGCTTGIAQPPASFPATDTVWFDDQLPLGSTSIDFSWDTTQKASGTQSHTDAPAAGFHQHYFLGASNPISLGASDKIFCYVLLNPCSPPQEIMLQFHDTQDTQNFWAHRAYWGPDIIFPSVQTGTEAKYPMGPLPQSGVWVRLEVPASNVGLVGKQLDGVAFTLQGGQAWFDRVGKTGSAVAQPAITSLTPSSGLQGQTISTMTITGSALSGATSVNFTPSTGITVSGISSSANQVVATVAISGSATTGQRNVSVTVGGVPSNSLPFTIGSTNPLPAIFSINPDNRTAGTGAFTLTVNGSGFLPASVVRVNGSNRVTNFVSSAQLTAQITAADTATAGPATIKVFNPAPGGGESTGITLTINPLATCQVTTLSGSGVYGYTEGASATAQWRSPYSGVTAKDPVTGLNVLFVADTDNNRIRMVYMEGANIGQSVLIAGNGTAGYGNGNGNALNARFNSPTGLAALMNASGVVMSLMVADTDNQMIRRLWPPVSTGGSWSVSDVAGQLVTPGADDGPGLLATFQFPRGIAVGTDGALYVCDSDNDAIRKIDQQTNVTTLVVGTNLGLIFPLGITASQTSGMLYFTDQTGNSVWRMTTAGSALKIAGSGIAGGTDGIGTNASFNKPAFLAWANTAGGEVLYIADRLNHKIRKLVVSTTAVSSFAGSGSAGFADGICSTALLNTPRGVAVGPSGEVYVVDSANNRIRKTN